MEDLDSDSGEIRPNLFYKARIANKIFPET